MGEPATSSDTLTTDLACAQCGFNLRGLSAQASCPECNAPVSWSLLPDQLTFANRQWLRRVSRGQAVLQIGIPALLLLLIPPNPVVLGGRRPNPQLVAALVSLVKITAVGLIALGVFWSTPREPRDALTDRLRWTRLAARTAALAWMTTVIVGQALGLLGTPTVRALVSVLSTVALFILTTRYLSHLAKLARRMPDARLVRRARFSLAALGLLGLLMIVLAILGQAGSASRPEQLVPLWIRVPGTWLGSRLYLATLLLQIALAAQVFSLIVYCRQAVSRVLAPGGPHAGTAADGERETGH
jgi:hypothetical protein